MLNRLRNLTKRIIPDGGNLTFSQCGEDRICAHLFDAVFRIPKPTYLDIGANDPVFLNNSYLFRLNGSTGVLVEPNPQLHAKLHARRQGDVCLNVGIGDADSNGAAMPFYVFDPPYFSTFVPADSEANQRMGHRLIQTVQIPLVSTTSVIEQYFAGRAPNLVSLDTEGYDEKILAGWDFTRFRPEVFCIETVAYESQTKITGIFSVMADRGYTIYADTFINTIFVESGKFRDRPRD